ncbi:MAG: ABC transporter permease, partial [Methylococcales bacterium]|nr:ABC transporter permease [Methylococcales bacterium]
VSKTIEDRVHLKYFDQETFATIKGVEENFTEANPIGDVQYLWDGEYVFDKVDGIAQGVFGQGVAAMLAINIHDKMHPIEITFLNDNASSLTNLADAILYERIYPSGVFAVQKEYDDKYVLNDLDFAREIFQQEGKLSSWELALTDPEDSDQIKLNLEKLLGPEYSVKTWKDLHQSLYRVMQNEKYISYLILSLLLAISAINIVGSLSMIVLEKTRDIAVLKSLGTTAGTIRKIFLMEGFFVGGIGVTAGCLIALIFGLLQQNYGLVSLTGGEDFGIPDFPMELQWLDFVLIFFTVIGLSLLAALYPSLKAAEIPITQNLKR